MPTLPHLQLDLTGDMSPTAYPPSIDPVIQSENPYQSYPPEYQVSAVSSPHISPTTTSFNRTEALSSPQQDTKGTGRTRNLSSTEEYGVQSIQNSERSGSIAKSQRLQRIRADEEEVSRSTSLVATPGSPTTQTRSFMTDFFSPEVFQVVLHNPTTAHRFLRFCQSRACGENMEFLNKVEKFNRLLDDVQRALGEIHTAHTSPDAPRQVNVTSSIIREVSADVRHTSQTVIPSMETIFLDAQQHVERLLAADTYPRFVKHQMTAQATSALSSHKERFEGLGDCFCLTDPNTADNPILFASDGFVAVTGYSRREIVPRNCRFLQGELTDPNAIRRLRASIAACEETVELILNYRKNGDPFWNLLYVAPLYNEQGEVAFFLGGQINCSTTIHSCTDVLRILSINDDELDGLEAMRQEAGSRGQTAKRPESIQKPTKRTFSSFFKSYRKYTTPKPRLNPRDQTGMEQELLQRVGRMNFKTQVEAFYTAYSKYLVLTYNPTTSALLIQHYSPGVIDMLCLNLPNGAIAPIFNKDVFKILGEHSSSSTSVQKAFKETVRLALRAGKAVSVEMGLLTGFEERKGNNWFGDKDGLKRVEERYVTHWTPLKDEEGRSRWAVLTIAPKM